MPSNYQGVLTNTQPPSATPSFSASPILSLPSDGDALNASSVIQAFKACVDYLDFLRLKLAPVVGIRTYDGGIAYVAGDIVRYATDGYYYRCTSGVTGGTGPASDTAHWARFAIDLGTLSGTVMSGATVTTGDGSVAECHTLNFPATTYKMLVMRVTIRNDDENVITLTGDTAFANYAIAATATCGGGVNYLDPATLHVEVATNSVTIGVDAGGVGGSGGNLNLVVYGC